MTRLLRLAQHRFGDVDADERLVVACIVRQRDAGADADLENASADALGRRDRGMPRASRSTVPNTKS